MADALEPRGASQARMRELSRRTLASSSFSSRRCFASITGIHDVLLLVVLDNRQVTDARYRHGRKHGVHAIGGSTGTHGRRHQLFDLNASGAGKGQSSVGSESNTCATSFPEGAQP